MTTTRSTAQEKLKTAWCSFPCSETHMLSSLIAGPSRGSPKVLSMKSARDLESAHHTEQRALCTKRELSFFKLVSAGATPKQWAEWLRTPPEHAAAAGNHNLFKRSVDAGAKCGPGWTGCGGRTLLAAAAVGGNVDVVSECSRRGLDQVLARALHPRRDRRCAVQL